MKTIKDVLSVELVDDYTPNGGKAFSNETVEDFIKDTDLSTTDSIQALNRELKLCGIKPIIIKKS